MYICKFPIIAGEETGKGWYASIDSDYILYYDFDTNEYSFNQEPCDSRPVFNPECNELLPIKAFNYKFKMLTGGTMVTKLLKHKNLKSLYSSLFIHNRYAPAVDKLTPYFK